MPLPRHLPFAPILALAATLASAQQAPPAGQPQVRVNYLNVCTPSADEQKEIAAVLARIPQKPGFGPDFEIARGRTTMPDAPVSTWVRVRHDFPDGALFSNAQYSMSVDEQRVVETLVFRFHEPKDVLSISIEDGVSAATPAQVLATDTPATRLRIERVGKGSIGLARCQGADQSAYEPLFQSASQVLARYREALGVRRTVLSDLQRLGTGKPPARKPPAAAKPKP
ncbi:MAG TPA: hypothetical protein VEG08_13860 [Terriglobales bacterium]|nr:hypothetical protein [Terriglobales bacterium]